MSSDPEDKEIVVFGRDISKIPCFRNSYLYGISGGIGMGLLYFLFTSRVRTACDFSVGSFAVITLSYWVHCRYNYSKTKFEMTKVQEMLRRRAMTEGTNELAEIEPDTKPVNV